MEVGVEVTVVGQVFLLALVYCVALRRPAIPWVLSASTPFVATASVISSGNSVTPFFLLLLVIVAIPVLGWLYRPVDTALAAEPGRTSLLLFGLWATVISLLGPIYFAGTPVLDPRSGIDAEVQFPSLLQFGISNFAQVLYLLLGLAMVIYVGQVPGVSPQLPSIGFAIGTVFSTLRLVLSEDLTRELFDTAPNIRYINTTPDGQERLRGIFSEPSALATFSITALVFFAMSAARSTGRLRAFSLVMAAWCLLNLGLSSSGTALIGGLIVTGLLGGHALYRFASGRSRWSPLAVFGVFLSIPVVIVVLPLLYGSANGVIGDKVQSDSYAARSAADLFSLDLVGQTLGWGVGLGSNRPSSFLSMLLSCTGVIGTGLFFFAVARLVGGAYRIPAFQPSAWALVALLVTKCVTGPDMSEQPMWILMAVCANAAWRGPATAPTEAPPALDHVGEPVR
jgi:hypothetical protein